MPNVPTNKIPSNLDISPAQMVGGMRVKHPDARRASLKEENSEEANAMNAASEEGRDVLEDEQENMEEKERFRIRAAEERQAHDMQARAASRQPDITKNAGNIVKHQYITGTQPRSMNH